MMDGINQLFAALIDRLGVIVATVTITVLALMAIVARRSPELIESINKWQEIKLRREETALDRYKELYLEERGNARRHAAEVARLHAVEAEVGVLRADMIKLRKSFEKNQIDLVLSRKSEAEARQEAEHYMTMCSDLEQRYNALRKETRAK